MKKITLICCTLLLAVFLTACSQGNEKNDTTKNNEEPNQSENIGENQPNNNSNNEENTTNIPSEAENQDDMKKMMAALDFTGIEVEISYGKDKEFEIEIEHHSNGDIEAEVEDELNNIDIEDDLQAFNHIYPSVKKLEIEQGIKKQEVIDQVLSIFELDTNYEKLEIEIKFEDGTKLEFKD